MGAAAYILAINLFSSIAFAASFWIVSVRNRSAYGGRWLAVSYVLSVAYAVILYCQPYLDNLELLNFVAFTIAIGSLAAVTVGLSHHYRCRPPLLALALLPITSVSIYWVLSMLPRTDFARNALYQLPFAAVQVMGAFVVLRSRCRGPIDRILLWTFSLSALGYASKAILASLMGIGGGTQYYLASVYGTYSQMLQACFLTGIGLSLLLAMTWDLLAKATARSEIDRLTGLFNRGAFEDRARTAMAAAKQLGQPITVIFADLDHFKQVNDTHGHAAGDRVLTAFARYLGSGASPEAVVGRLGGEEFAVLLQGPIADGRAFAEAIRQTFGTSSLSGKTGRISVTASFGIAQCQPGERISDLLYRADMALYEAKGNGRNQVCISRVPLSAVPSLAPGAVQAVSPI